MAPKPASCVACGETFQANLQLATIPDAKRIAFDPALGRVWRICQACGEWNLLGGEAAAVALPELEARFRASPKRSTGQGFAAAQVGAALDLVRFGAGTTAGTNEIALLARRHKIQSMKRLRLVVVAACTVVVAWEFVAAYQDTASVLGVVQFIGSMGLIYLAYFVSRLRHKLQVNRRAMYLFAAVGVIGEAIWFASHQHWGAIVARAISLVIVTGLIALLPPWAYLTIPLPSGKTLRFYLGDNTKQVVIWWNTSGELFVGGIPRESSLGGADATTALRGLLKQRTAFAWKKTSDAAYDLVRTVGGLRGLFHALEGFRADNTGRVLLSDLPKVYLVALDLALAEEFGAVPRLPATQLARASAIATAAESLDREIRTLPGEGTTATET